LRISTIPGDEIAAVCGVESEDAVGGLGTPPPLLLTVFVEVKKPKSR